MPKYFCEYCGIYLIHSSPKGRRQHNGGRKHKQNKIEYYQQFLQEINAPTPGSYLTSQQMQQKLQTKMGLNIPKPVNLKQQNSIQTPSISELGQLATPGLNMLNIPGIMPSNITSLQFSNPLVNQQQLLMQQQQMGLVQAPQLQQKPQIPSLMNIAPK